jgi:hypothetical protein
MKLNKINKRTINNKNNNSAIGYTKLMKEIDDRILSK